MKWKRAMVMLLCCLLLLPVLPAHATKPEAIRIGFLDSGISLKHLDASQVESGENFVLPARDTTDRIGHGTATAGLVLGSSELGLMGLCPTAVAVPLVCYDLYPSGVTASGTGEDMARAIRAAVDQYDCRIINISMGLTTDDPELRAAVEYAQEQGVLVISAVGNDNLTAPERVYYPAAYDGVIGVGAADGEKTAAFSQRSNVDFLAPGVALDTVSNRNAAESVKRNGTSYACAYVSGVCAAILTAQPELTAEQVYDLLVSMAQDIEQPGFDTDSGWGIVSIGYESEEIRNGTGLTDIDGHWAEESIIFCVEQGLFSGVGNNRFDPNGQMTRAMFAAIVYRVAGSPETGADGSFCDVNEEKWYAQSIAWAVSAGLMGGYGNGMFGPDDYITREQAAVILYRYAAACGLAAAERDVDLLLFDDGAECSDYAVSALQWAVGVGVLQGANGKLMPREGCTRAQAAQILKNFMTMGETSGG